MLDVDFYVFLGYKLYVLVGIGVLYGKMVFLEVMLFWYGGGKMVEKVLFDGIIFTGLFGKFEVGMLNVVGVIVLVIVIDWY